MTATELKGQKAEWLANAVIELQSFAMNSTGTEAKEARQLSKEAWRMFQAQMDELLDRCVLCHKAKADLPANACRPCLNTLPF